MGKQVFEQIDRIDQLLVMVSTLLKAYEEVIETVSRKLIQLRSARLGLVSLGERDRFGNDPTLATQRQAMFVAISEVVVYCEIKLCPLIAGLLEQDNQLPSVDLRQCLNEIAGCARSLAETDGSRSAYPPGLPREAYLGDGIDQLTGFTKDSGLRNLLQQCRPILERIRKQCSVVADYKDVHDQLHQIEFNCFNLIGQEIKRFPDDEVAHENLMHHAQSLEEALRQLKSLEQSQNLDPAHMGWVGQVQVARDFLAEALATKDPARVKSCHAALGRILAREPIRINFQLIQESKALLTEEHLAALREIEQALRQTGAEEAAHRFTEDVDRLSSLGRRLEQLVSVHNNWQRMESELRLMEAGLEDGLEGLTWSLNELRNLIEKIGHIENQPGIRELDAVRTRMADGLVAADSKEVKRQYKDLRRRVGTQFYSADSELRRLCGELRRVREPLGAVLERIV